MKRTLFVAAAFLALFGCRQEQSPGEMAREAEEKARQAGREVGETAERAGEKVGQTAERAEERARQEMGEARQGAEQEKQQARQEAQTEVSQAQQEARRAEIEAMEKRGQPVTAQGMISNPSEDSVTLETADAGTFDLTFDEQASETWKALPEGVQARATWRMENQERIVTDLQPMQMTQEQRQQMQQKQQELMKEQQQQQQQQQR